LAIADAKRGHTLQNREIKVGCSWFQYGTGASTQDDRIGSLGSDPLSGGCPRDHFGVDSEFTYAANNELRVLAAEIDDKNGLVVGH
jgi:hypothetical protein